MHYFLSHKKINDLLKTLSEMGYTCIGPQVQNGAIVFEELHDAKQLPWGIRDSQEPGKYRLEESDLKEAFAWANGPQAIKPLLFKPKESLWRVERDATGAFTFKETMPENKPIALIGARACDLAGMAIQDKTLLQGQYVDQQYRWHREHLL